MSDPGVRRRPGGRSARVRAAVLDATLELLLAHELEGLKVSEVAERAQVHETSIYRRWGTRENLLLDALLSATEQLQVPDTGSLRTDLTAYATDLAKFLATPVGRALEQTLAAGDDPETQRARDRYWASRYERSRQMITRAIDRGELPDIVQPRLILEMLVSPVHFRAVLTREPVDPECLLSSWTRYSMVSPSHPGARRRQTLAGDSTSARPGPWRPLLGRVADRFRTDARVPPCGTGVPQRSGLPPAAQYGRRPAPSAGQGPK